jgi:hypothetical protein
MACFSARILPVPVGGNGVGHIEHRGDAAERGARRAAGEIFLVGITGIAEMDVHVDGAGQHVKAGGVQRFLRRRHRLGGAHRQYDAVLDGDARLDRGIGGHHGAVADDEIGGHAHLSLITSPSRHRREDRRR